MGEWLNRTHVGDCRDLMRQMIADGVRVQCVVTSPPYYGLRDYGMPGQLGIERTLVRYIARLRGVFRLVWDLLADDGVVWLNLGDSYCSTAPGTMGDPLHARGILAGVTPETAAARRKYRPKTPQGLKPKDLMGIPWRVALALQADGWYLRSDIIWHKPACLPESVTDRPTRCHEYLFLLTKSERYYYDADAIAEPSVSLDESHTSYRPNSARIAEVGRKEYSAKHAMSARNYAPTRNKRSVWTVNPTPFPGAHFATFPRKLIEPCILAGTASGGVVFDPYMGSGTTAEVATDLGRNFVGCELNRKYLELHRQTTIGMPF